MQAAGRIPCAIAVIGADLLTLSAHKIGGPKGIGALVRLSEDIHLADPLIRGGGQERGMRAGTENVAGIAGFGAAAASASLKREEEAARMLALRDLLEDGLRAVARRGDLRGRSRTAAEHDAVFARRHEGRDGGHRLRPRRGRAVVRRRLLVGQSAAIPCPCGHGGFAAVPAGCLRASLGWETTEADVDRLLGAWRKVSAAIKLTERRRPSRLRA